MIVKPLAEQNIVSISPQDIPRVIEIAELSNLSQWTFEDYSDEIARSDSIGLAYKKYVSEKKAAGRAIIIGFVIARLIRFNSIEQKSFTVENSRDSGECEILNIGVHPSFRRNGIGQKLFEATVEKCLLEGAKSIWLEVRKNNSAAIEFYRGNGFEIIYTRNNYYQSPLDDALVMRMELDDQTLL